ncbi:hypothetical protein P43SY_006067 [Pythium insidiosum]|uniref:C2 domain-containing protein n=1 Tax=Pythium insidiosum TaxID=114742 RepID=A0AAD5LHI0_PYTIN|nr:hypothetical protein P43SY_006067 [Pythium insidiosum]
MPTLTVTLLSASDLPASDTGAFQGGKSDPYVHFQLGHQIQRSTCVEKTLNPVWQPAENFEFEIENVRTEVLRVVIYDHDTWNPDDLIASTAVPLTKFIGHEGKLVSETLALVLPDEFESQNRKSSIQLEFRLSMHDSSKKVFLVWENETYSPTSGWHPCDSSDRMQWSSYDEKRTSSRFEEIAPAIPAHLVGKGWGYSAKRGDPQGWVYASTFAGPWGGKTALSFARRRLWENICEAADGSA